MLGMDWEASDWAIADLAPEVRAVVRERDELNVPPVHTLSVEGARTLLGQIYEPASDPEPVASVWDVAVSGRTEHVTGADSVPVRVYRPSGEPPFPVMVWFHGGGFVFGGLDSTDSICRRFANAGDCVVVSVDYRRAPEHPFPAAVTDCYAATTWAVEHADVLGGDPDRVGVGGGSAGGNLAAAVSLLARDLGAPDIAYQLLVYPTLDRGLPPNEGLDRPSYRENPDGARSSLWYASHYLRTPVDAMNPYARPMVAADLTGLPRAEVLTVEYDVLRDEGRAYAERLRDADVPVTHTHYDDLIHPLFNLDVPQADEAISAVAQRFRKATA